MDEQSITLSRGGAQAQNELSLKILRVIADGQRKLLTARRRRHLREDPRSVENLRVVEERLRQEAA